MANEPLPPDSFDIPYSPEELGSLESAYLDDTIIDPTLDKPDLPAKVPTAKKVASPPSSVRLPSQDIPAEQSVLGGLLLNSESYERISGLINADDFYRHSHRLIWDCITHMVQRNRDVDALTVADALRTDGKLEEVGGTSYLNELAQNTPSAANIETYAQIIRQHSLLRRLVTASEEIIADAYEPKGRDARILLDEAEAKIFKIKEAGAQGISDFKSMQDLMVGVLEQIEAASKNPSAVTGLPTGFQDLDEKTAGLHPGQLIIVAGRPAMGKTSFSMNIVEHVAIESKKTVAVFSMEMGAEQLAERMVGSVGRIDHQRMRTGQLTDEEWPKLSYAIQQLESAPIMIDDTPGLTPLEVRAKARRLQRRCNGELGLIMIDYLQLMAGNRTRAENRATEISEISRALKGLAVELKCPIIALSQLNRSLESRNNKRPLMSDLRESGAIEQDADLILFIYRDEVYNPDTPDKGTAEIIIGKQRSGPTGMVRLTFQGEYTRFANYTSGNAFVPD